MGLGHSPKVVTSNLALSLDFASVKNFNPSTNLVSSSVERGASWEIVNRQYVNFDYSTGAAIFTRDLSVSLNVAQKNISGGTIKTTGNLYRTAANTLHYTSLYYNDHTFEVWFQINNPAPSQYDATETSSVLVGHRGYNNGFNYNSTQMNYVVWNGSTGGNTILSWTIGASSEIRANQWYQIVAKRNGTTWTRYLNGTPLSSRTENPAINAVNGNLGDIHLGGGWENNSNYQYFGINTIGNFKIYNKALTDQEIQQNFNALRGRFGI